MSQLQQPVSIPEASPADDFTRAFFIGYHESNRTRPVTNALLCQAQEVGYDMLTSPITTLHFQQRILKLVSNYLSEISLSISSTDSLRNAPSAPIISPLTPMDISFSPGDSFSQLIAYSSPWIDICSADSLISNISRQVLNIEIAYASFCGIGNVIIPGPRFSSPMGDRLIQYARAIQEALKIGSFTQIAIRIPISTMNESRFVAGDLGLLARDGGMVGIDQGSKEPELFETWDSWNLIRSVCKYNSRLSVALDINQALPIESLQSRWYAEPLRIISFYPSTFLKNRGGYPVLTKNHQDLIFRYMRLKMPPWIMLCDVEPLTDLNESKENVTSSPAIGEFKSLSTSGDVSDSISSLNAEAKECLMNKDCEKITGSQDANVHLNYLRHLQKNQPARSSIELFGWGFQDYLQEPLQPLADNLESVTYEVFEKDPVKYDLYEKSLVVALSDWSKHDKPTSSSNGAVVVAVVGSGRGPLVTRALRASKTTNVPVELWAVEKNPNAYVLLQKHNKEDWGGVVNVVKSDMRAWKGPYRQNCCQNNGSKDSSSSNTIPPSSSYSQVDILVSELLGSFADNELSPECLDGVQHLLATEHGISIPSSYTAHITPIFAPRLYANITTRSLTDDTAFEMPYVVMLDAIDFLASSVPNHARIQEVWEFNHPISNSTLAVSNMRRSGGVSGGGGGSMFGGDGANEHNVRAKKLKFVCKDRGVVHGIAGYFEAVLYDSGKNGKIELSTRPDRIEAKSKDMISWFPIYFPLKSPLYFPDDSELEVSVWRQTDDRKVWYEWLVEAFLMVGPENRIRLGASDMGSSRKLGCLM